MAAEHGPKGGKYLFESNLRERVNHQPFPYRNARKRIWKKNVRIRVIKQVIFFSFLVALTWRAYKLRFHEGGFQDKYYEFN